MIDPSFFFFFFFFSFLIGVAYGEGIYAASFDNLN
jgi:hypothetical protein